MLVNSSKLLVGSYKGELVQVKFSLEGIAQISPLVRDFEEDLIQTKLKEILEQDGAEVDHKSLRVEKHERSGPKLLVQGDGSLVVVASLRRKKPEEDKTGE